MRIDGKYTFAAPRKLVWSLLNDPAAAQRAIPGCEQLRKREDGQYVLALNLPTGPLRGQYAGTVTLLQEKPQKVLALSLTGSGPECVFSGQGTLTLAENDEQTELFYEGTVDVSGQIPAQSPRLIRTTANFLIRSFLEALDLQICQITGITGQNGLPSLEEVPIERSTPTIGMQDFLAEVRRDRWIAVVVLVLALLATLSLLGAVFLGLLALRWVTRSFASRTASSVPVDPPAAEC